MKTIAAFALSTSLVVSVLGQEPAINPSIDINQQQLLNGKVPFRKVMESGRHLFSTPFMKADGFGEGIHRFDQKLQAWVTVAEGPREKDFNDNLQKLAKDLGVSLDKLKDTFKVSLPVPNFEFLRLNGLDSQSCFECHNSIGSDNLSDNLTEALARKVGVNGGPAGFASTAFINPTDRKDPMDLNSPIKDGGEGFPYHLFKLVRNPPHVFGTGYAQELAEEMSGELLAQKMEALIKAAENPGVEQPTLLKVSQPRENRPLDFGTFKVTYNGPLLKPGAIKALAKQWVARPNIPTLPANGSSPFKEDYSGVIAVSPDFAVRPFQWKGIASNERNFVKDALNFHFGMLAVEKQRSEDEDHDGVKNEVSLGNVSALTVFTMSIRPPVRTVPKAESESQEVAKGVELFLKGPKPNKDEFVNGQATACASCHIPTMRIHSNIALVPNPQPKKIMHLRSDLEFSDSEPNEPMDRVVPTNNTGLSSQRETSADLPVFRRFARSLLTDGETQFKRQEFQLHFNTLGAAETDRSSDDVFSFNLTTLQFVKPVVPADVKEPPASPSFTQPRLREVDSNSGPNPIYIDVPLFSDLRRHKMGKALADRFKQETDVSGIFVDEDLFLTRPIWGVADTAPFLHDGRAVSLEDAILAHSSEGSEATDLIAALSPDQRKAIVSFLLTLRLPTDPRYAADANQKKKFLETNEPLEGTTQP